MIIKAKRKTQNAERKTQNAERGILNTEYKMRKAYQIKSRRHSASCFFFIGDTPIGLKGITIGTTVLEPVKNRTLLQMNY
jgi:hypothetical protein